MKKAMLLLVLMLLATAIFAQKSLYDLEFGAEASKIIPMLKAKGFVEDTLTGYIRLFKSGKDADLPELKLYLDLEEKFVTGWKLSYDISTKPDLPNTILANLAKLHGEYSEKDEFDYDYIWYFPNDKALYIDIFTGEMILDYAVGNWEDDDYYYYYWDEY